MKVLELRQKIEELQKELEKQITKGLNYGDSYYFITTDGKVCWCAWGPRPIENDRAAFGNVFKTEEEAESARNKVRDLLGDL